MPRRRMIGDLLVHQRLGERRLVAFVVAVAAVADHVHHHVLLEALAVFDRDARAVDDRFRVVGVDVEDRRVDHLGDVRTIGRRAREFRRRREADLVVDDEVNSAAGAITAQAGKIERFRNEALAGERRIAVQQQAHDLLAFLVAALALFAANLAEHDRVDALKVRRVRRQRQVHRLAVEHPVRRGAQVILHVARTLHVVGVRRRPLEFGEDRLERLAHDVGQHVQAAAMRHAEHDFLDAQLAAAFENLFQPRHQAFAAVEPEALGARELLVEVLLEAFGLDQAAEDGKLAAIGEVGLVADRLDAFLDPCLLVRILNVHELDADGVAVGFLQDRDDLAHRGRFEPEHVIDEDLAIHIAFFEPVSLRVQFRVLRRLFESERVQVGEQVAALRCLLHRRPRGKAGQQEALEDVRVV